MNETTNEPVRAVANLDQALDIASNGYVIGGLLTSKNIAKIAAAFALAQDKVGEAEKTRRNEHFGQGYATLASTMEACKGALNSNGIGVIQFPAKASKPTVIAVGTLLLHSSGEFMVSVGEFDIGGRTGPQAYGSALTYARRYFLAAMVGVCPEDDDAERAEGRDGQQPEGRAELPQGRSTIRKPADDGI